MHKEHLSTDDAIVKLESHIGKSTKSTQLILMDLAKAFDKANRAILWTTLYKKGLPVDMIAHIRKGHQNTTLIPKTKGKYGQPTENNVGVSQWSAISALLFIIYQEDMMGDYQSLNYKNQLPLKHTMERTTEEIAMCANIQIRLQFEQKRGKTKSIEKLYQDQQKIQKKHPKQKRNSEEFTQGQYPPYKETQN